MSDEIKAVNYSAHAIGDLLRQTRGLALTAPRSAARLRAAAAVLKDTVKFLLPNRCELLDSESISQAHLDLLRLPYPCVALEAPWEGDDLVEVVGGMEQAAATRRIALCWQIGPGIEPYFGIDDPIQVASGEGVCVLPIFKFQGRPEWTVAPVGAFLPADARVVSLSEASMSAASQLALAAQREAGFLSRSKSAFQMRSFIFLPEVFDGLVATLGEDRALATVINDVHDEVSMVVQACAVLNCANVETSDLHPAAALNKQRVAKAQQPFFSYKVLTLSTARAGSAIAGGAGTHVSPRTHLRRGHLRRLPDRAIWVRPAIVGKDGVIHKDYKLVK